MKIIFIVLLLFISPLDFQEKTKKIRKQEKEYYICLGSWSYTYHRYNEDTCKGLAKCTKNIIKITETKAKKQGRSYCKYLAGKRGYCPDITKLILPKSKTC